jgi:hypothetical protein
MSPLARMAVLQKEQDAIPIIDEASAIFASCDRRAHC